MRRGDRQVGPDVLGAGQVALVAVCLVGWHDDPVRPARLCDQLWEGQPPKNWRVSIRVAMSHLRGVLRDLGAQGDPIPFIAGAYRLASTPVEVDVVEAAAATGRAAVALGQGQIDEARRLAATARAVLSRPVLPGIDSPLADEFRRQATSALLDALHVAAECRRANGEFSAAVSVARHAVDLDALRESSWRDLMRAHASAGEMAAALRAYDECRRRLANDIGVEPSTATRRLHELLARGDVDVAGEGSSEPTPPTTPAAPGGPAGPAGQPMPYRGLLAFGSADADMFFGRDVQVQELLGRLDRFGVVAVTGPSGSGKTSLVRAGLLPALTTGALPDSDLWRPVVMIPGPAPSANLFHALRQRDGPHASAGRVTPEAVEDAILQLLEARRGDGVRRIVLVVDQAEELFTATASNTDERAAFVDAVLTGRRRLGGRMPVVLVLRSDFIDRAAEVPLLADLLSTSQYVVPSMGAGQLEAAIAQPADRAGMAIESGLVGEVLGDVLGRPGALPLLQYAMLEVWRRRDGDLLTLAAYRAIGGIDGALRSRADAIVDDLDASDRDELRRLFLHLVETEVGTADVRRRVPRVELSADFPSAARLDDLLRRLVDARLLTVAGDARTSEPTVEIAHEALLREWPRMRAWIEDRRDALVSRRRTQRAASEWIESGRDPNYLLRGSRLEQAQHGLAEAGLGTSRSVQQFIDASFRQGQADAQARRRRRAVRQAGRLAVHAVTTRVEDPELSTLLALASVDHSRRHGLAPEPGAVGALHRAVQASRLVSRFQAGGSRLVAASPDGSWVAVDRDAQCLDPVVIDTATGVSQSLPGPTVPPGANLPVGLCALTAHPDGTRLAAGYDHDPDRQQAPNRNSRGHNLPPVVIFDVAAGTVDQVLNGPPGFYWSMSFRDDGSLLAAADGVRTVVVWDTESWDVAATHEIGRDIAQVMFDPSTGDLLVMSVDPPGLVRAEPRTGERLQFLELPSGVQSLFAVHPRGESVALGNPGGRVVEIRDLVTWEVVHAWPAPLAMCAAWSPDSHSVAHAGSRGVITVRDVATGRRICELAGSTTVRTIAFLGDSDHLVNPTWDGQTLVWNASPAGRPHLQAIATNTGTIDRFWSDDTGSTVGITTHDPPTFQLVDITTGRGTRTIQLATELHALVLDGIAAVASDGLEHVAALRPDGRCTIHQVPDLEVVAELNRFARPLAVDTSGRYVALNAIDPDMPNDDRALTCEIWDIAANQPCLINADGAGSVAFTRPTGSHPPLVAISSNSREVHLHDLQGPTHMGTLALDVLDRSFYAGLAFSPDGRHLAGETQEGTAWVINVEAVRGGSSMAEAIVFRTTTHQGPTTHPGLTDDGLLATVGFDAHLRLWDIHHDRLVADFGIDLGSDQIPTLQLSPDQRGLHYVEAGAVIRRFPLDLDDLVAMGRHAVTRDLTDEEKTRHGLADDTLIRISHGMG